MNQRGSTNAGTMTSEEISPVVCSKGKWRLGGIIAYLHREYDWLRERIPHLPPHLPSHCVDPVQIARFLGEDIQDFDFQGSNSNDVLSAIQRIEKRLDGGVTQTPAVEAAARMLTTKEVAQLLGCSYSQARKLMLEGRLKSIKDGRLLRSRREWVEDYLLAQMVQKPDPQPAEIKVKRRKVKLVGDFKKGGIAYEFLRSRPD